jgi:hypothetical protein
MNKTPRQLVEQKTAEMETLHLPGLKADHLARLRNSEGDEAAARVLLAYSKTHQDGALVAGTLFHLIALTSSAPHKVLDEFNAAIQRVMRGC